jgi:glycosyltransferase involved in cell wall biosynthesis
VGESLIVSIIICTKNRARDLSITLESICLQKYKPNYIIIVDDSNNSETRKVIDEYSDIIYFHPSSPHSGLPAARNAGLKYVPPETEIVLFLDDDVTLDENYLFEMVKKFEASSDIYGMTGNAQTIYQRSPLWKKVIYAIVGFVIPQLVPTSINSCLVTKSGIATSPLFYTDNKWSMEWLSGCNMAYRHAIFKQGAKFDEVLVGYAMGEDMLFSHKLYLSGKRLWMENKSLINHRCSEENRSDDLRKIIMTLAYRRYIIENITREETLSKLYYLWFSNMFLLSAHILCAVGKRDKEYLSDCFTAKKYVSREPNITKINRFIRGEQ